MENSFIDYALLWEKIGDYARKAGRVTARPILLMYHVLKSPDTPTSDKVLIYASLAYVVMPFSLISARRFPILGLVDEVVSLTIVYKKVCKYITPEIESKVDNILEGWFPEAKYEVIP